MPGASTSKSRRWSTSGAAILALAIFGGCTETVVIGEGLGESGPSGPSSSNGGPGAPSSEPPKPSDDGVVPLACATAGAPPPAANACGAYNGMPLYACDIPGASLLGADEHGLYAYRYPVAATDDPSHTIYRLAPDNSAKILSTFTREALGAETVVFFQGELFVLDRAASSIEALRSKSDGTVQKRTIRLDLPGYNPSSIHVLDCHRFVAAMETTAVTTLGGGLYLFDEGTDAGKPRSILKTLDRPLAIGKEHVYYAKVIERDFTHLYRTPLAGGPEEVVYTAPPEAATDAVGILSVFVVDDVLFVVQRVLAAVTTSIPRGRIRLVRQPIGGGSAQQKAIDIGSESALGGVTVGPDAIYYVYGNAIVDSGPSNLDPKPDDPMFYRNALFRASLDLPSAVKVVEYGTLPPRSTFKTVAANMGPVVAGDRVYFGAWDRIDQLKTGKTGRILSHALP